MAGIEIPALCMAHQYLLTEEMPEVKACCFPAKGQSLTYSSGNYAEIETTALAVLAMVKTGSSVWLWR